MRAAYDALVAGDRHVATTSVPVPGGVRFITPELPLIRDYNATVLAPGAVLSAEPDVRRVIAFDGEDGLPGFESARETVMAFAGPAPERPDGAEEVAAEMLREARGVDWYGVGGRELEQLREMQDRQAAAGRLFAVFEDGAPLAWAQVLAGVIADVHVVPEARRRGLGRVVTRATMAAGGRWLMVDPGNGPAVALYRSLGFEAIGTVLQLTRVDG